MQRLEFKAVEDKIHTFVPQFSVVGMILEHMEDYTVVNSNGGGVMQHELLTWEVTKDSFVCLDRISKGSRFIDHTLKDWLNSLSMEEREQFSDTVYKLLTSGDKHSVNQFADNKIGTANALLKTYAGLDDKTKKALRDTFFKLVKSAGNTIKK